MSEQTVTFAQHIGRDNFVAFRLSFDSIREGAGFRRAARFSRSEYRVNGARVSRAVWMALKETAMAHVERLEKESADRLGTRGNHP